MKRIRKGRASVPNTVRFPHHVSGRARPAPDLCPRRQDVRHNQLTWRETATPARYGERPRRIQHGRTEPFGPVRWGKRCAVGPFGAIYHRQALPMRIRCGAAAICRRAAFEERRRQFGGAVSGAIVTVVGRGVIVLNDRWWNLEGAIRFDSYRLTSLLRWL